MKYWSNGADLYTVRHFSDGLNYKAHLYINCSSSLQIYIRLVSCLLLLTSKMIVSQVNLKPLSTREILLKMTCYEFESDFQRILMIFFGQLMIYNYASLIP